MSPTEKAISDYRGLLKKALLIVSAAPHFFYVEHKEFATLSVDGDTATIDWIELESDYFEGGSTVNKRNGSFPANLLSLDDDTIIKLQKEAAAEERKRTEKVARAQEVIRREREEARDRHQLAWLISKYGPEGGMMNQLMEDPALTERVMAVIRGNK